MHRSDSSHKVTGTPTLSHNQRAELRKTAHIGSQVWVKQVVKKHKQMFAEVDCQLSVADLRIEGPEARPFK